MASDNIQSSNSSSIFTYLPIYIFIGIVVFYKYDFFKSNLIDKVDNNVLFIGTLCLCMAIIIIYIQKGVSENYQNPNTLYTIIVAFIVFVFLIVFRLSSFQYFIAKSLVFVFLGLIILLLLAMIYQFLSNYLQKQTGWTGFIVRFIFYIPCLFTDFLKYILDEYNNTPTIIFALFILQILIILTYFYLPKLISLIMSQYSIQMLKEPVKLNTQTTLKFPSNIYNYYDRIELLKKNVQNNKTQIKNNLNGKMIEVNSDTESITETIASYRALMNEAGCSAACKDNYLNMITQLTEYNIAISNEIERTTSAILLKGGADYPAKKTQNYSLSLWVNLNTQSTSRIKKDTPTNIFKYSSSPTSSSGHPMIAYSNNETVDAKHESYVIYFENDNGRSYQEMVDDGAIYLISLPSQKWHNFVFTYTDNKVDLFINGNLVKTHLFSDIQRNNLIEIDNNMYIGTPSVGNDLYNYGVYGAVCNVVYYTIPIEMSTIIYNYNLCVVNNPPYII